MFKIKLNDDYTASNHKRIGSFTVTRNWKTCTADQIKPALPFEGKIYLIQRAVVESMPGTSSPVVDLPQAEPENTETNHEFEAQEVEICENDYESSIDAEPEPEKQVEKQIKKIGKKKNGKKRKR